MEKNKIRKLKEDAAKRQTQQQVIERRAPESWQMQWNHYAQRELELEKRTDAY